MLESRISVRSVAAIKVPRARHSRVLSARAMWSSATSRGSTDMFDRPRPPLAYFGLGSNTGLNSTRQPLRPSHLCTTSTPIARIRKLRVSQNPTVRLEQKGKRSGTPITRIANKTNPGRVTGDASEVGVTGPEIWPHNAIEHAYAGELEHL